MSISRVDGLSTGPPVLGHHSKNVIKQEKRCSVLRWQKQRDERTVYEER